MKKIDELEKYLYAERKKARLLKEYYSHKEKSLDNLITMRNNTKLLHDILMLLEYDSSDVDLVKCKDDLFESCLKNKNIVKKEDEEVEVSKKKIDNIREKIKENKKSEIDQDSENLHEDVESIYNSVLDAAPDDIKEEMIQRLSMRKTLKNEE